MSNRTEPIYNTGGQRVTYQEGAASVYNEVRFRSLSKVGYVATHIHQAKVGQAADKGTTISRERQTEAPKLPLKADYRHDSESLKDHSERRLAPRHATVQQADAWDDEEDEAAHDDLVHVFELPSFVLLVDVDLLWIAAIWKRRAVRRLRWLANEYQR